MTTYSPNLKTNKLQLQPLCSQHWDDYLSLYTNAEVMRHVTIPFTREQTQELFKAALQAQQHNGRVNLHISHKASCDFVGIAGLIPQHKSSAEVGILLIPDCTNKGYGCEVIAHILDYGFTTLGLTCIYARYKPENIAAERLFARLGFILDQAPLDTPYGPMKRCEIVSTGWRSSDFQHKGLTIPV